MMTSRRETLLDFFDDFAKAEGDFFVYDNGYRVWTYSYREVTDDARAFAARLRHAGLGKGEKVILWGENRPEWLMAFWGCLLEGVIVVPIDYRASSDFLNKVHAIVDARVVLIGDEVSLPSSVNGAAVWHLSEVRRPLTPRKNHETDSLSDLVAGMRRSSGASPERSSQEKNRLEMKILDAPLRGPSVPRAENSPLSIAKDDIVEIIFTSGATAEPKGVVITHRNLLANIVPIETEMAKYRKYSRPFSPIRFLNLLPLSHLFGQAMATFIPPMLPGAVVFMRGCNPNDIIERVHKRRVSVIVCVPKILDVLREHVVRIDKCAAEIPRRKRHFLWRWWKHRRIHHRFGWKFWSFVVGAAPLDPELEEFWSRLGYLVVQGYGLTETAPIVSLNHPMNSKKGSVGKPMPGVEVKIAPDGEILVRGENVTSGYYGAPAEAAEAFEAGWLHTGDVGKMDEDDRLHVLGRKKEMIVTPEGLNVFPEDVEKVLNSIPGVRDSAVVGMHAGSEERVHAVLVLERGSATGPPLVHPAEIQRLANLQLGDHQKIRGVTIWSEEALPRTEGTQKLKRRLIKESIQRGETPPVAAATADPLQAILAKFARGRELTAKTTLAALGLSSLERVELLLALENRFQTHIDEVAFAAVSTLGDLQALVSHPPAETREETHAAAPAESFVFPEWSRKIWARAFRGVGLPGLVFPLMRLFAWIRVEGREHLQGLEGPVIFAANHQSHFDVPAILASLPARWRYRVAPAMSKEYYHAHFFPHTVSRWKYLSNSLSYVLSVLFFNTFPLPRREAGVRQTLHYSGELVGNGFSILIFPEGKRTAHGEINRFQPGVGMMAVRLEVPVVPIRLEGFDRILHRDTKMARPGRARVVFGPALCLEGDDYAALAKRVEEAVKAL